MPWNQAENKDELGSLEQRVVRSMSRLSETTYLPEVIQSYRLLKTPHQPVSLKGLYRKQMVRSN